MQSAPVRAVRVQHIKTETGQWVDRLLPARKLTPERKTEVMVAMYERCVLPQARVSCVHRGAPSSEVVV